MTDKDENGWHEYSKLVLKELEVLGRGIESVKHEISDVRHDLLEMRNRVNRVDDLHEWKTRIDDVVSPVQLQHHVDSIAELKAFRTKAVTIFGVIQFLMALALFLERFIN